MRYIISLVICLFISGCGPSEAELEAAGALDARNEKTARLQQAVELATSSADKLKYTVELVRHAKYKSLNLMGLGLTELPEDVFDGMEHVTRVMLEDNKLTSMPEGISKLTNLFRYRPWRANAKADRPQ